MPGVSKEQIEKAKEWDLLSYLQIYEPQELVRCGREYRLRSHDSLKLSNGKWHWHSCGIGGRTALDYLIRVKGVDFVSAVEKLCGERAAGNMPLQGTGMGKGVQERAENPLLPFTLPEINRYASVAVSYLQRRGIDADIISYCIGKGLLYESRQYQNCVFVGRDPEGKVCYACLEGTRGTFKGEAEGSDKRYGFCLPAADKESPSVAVAESPVDALSVATLLKIKGKEWQDYHYLSLGGTAPRALIQFLQDHPFVTRIALCLDNDRAGLMGMERIRKALQEEKAFSGRILKITDDPPPERHGKDYNDFLRKKRAAIKAPASVVRETAWR